MRPIELTAMLAADAEGLCRILLPGGKRQGSEWKCADLSGKPGDSLGVKLVGPKAGLWSDFATGDKGDMLGLIKAVKGIQFQDALEWAKNYLGIRDTVYHALPKSPKPKPIPAIQQTDVDAKVMTWFEKKRGIHPDTVRRFRLTSEGPVLAFPYYHGQDLMHVKYRDLSKPKKEAWRSTAGTTPILFGWQAVPDDERDVVITEGELDAMSYADQGISAMSVPNGAGVGDKLRWIALEWDRLERFDTIYLSFDMDVPGQETWPAVVERLGHYRCRIIQLPLKDANECHIAGNDLGKYKMQARYCDPPELRPAESFADDVKRLFQHEEATQGDKLPWEKANDNFRMRGGELTIWHGRNGDGKSMILSMIAARLILLEGKRVCVASMELPAAKLLRRMYQQIAGEASPSMKQIDDITVAITDHGWLVNITGTAKAELLLKLADYAYRRYGCTHIIIDSLAKCGFAEDDYNGQKQFVDQLTDFAKARPVHVHLVCHDRKDSTDNMPPSKLDVKGTGAITDMADNVVAIYRNRAKEADPAKHEDEGDVYLHVQKQRHFDWEGKIVLWFDTRTHQYIEYPSEHPRSMIAKESDNGIDEV